MSVYVGQAVVDGVPTDVINQHSGGVKTHNDWMQDSGEYLQAPAQVEFVHLRYPGNEAMSSISPRRIVLAVALALAIVALTVAGVWGYTWLTQDEGPSMGAFGPEEQREKAEELVAGLNTRDVSKVPVLYYGGSYPAQETARNQTIEAAMPAPDCRYALVSVADRGEQGAERFPWSLGEVSTYRFDMVVDEWCPGRNPARRTVGVIAVADMSYWNPMAFTT